MKCPKCGNNRMHTKVKHRKIDGALQIIDICYTKGCGYRNDKTSYLPSAAEIKAKKAIEQGQKEFSF